ncbi:MAG: polyphenol oxidase family protein, partial [Campylobacterota bacterium]|nr:polyphenol oxidase family protein [Campylobacterota bacterium]
NIIKNVVESFVNNYSCDAKDIFVSIGANIGKCCYEVGSEIYTEATELSLEYAIDKRDNSFYLDISKVLKNQLLASGVNEKNIEISSECSCCKNDKYFSYRADGITGRFAGVLVLLG